MKKLRVEGGGGSGKVIASARTLCAGDYESNERIMLA